MNAVHRETGRPARGDAEGARGRLLHAALHRFAQQGFAKTSIREVAEAAAVNVAAIAYYFGDKAGLYRAAYRELLGAPEVDVARFADPRLAPGDALHAFYATFLEPLKQGEDVRLCLKLHFRELLEPSGVLDDGFAEGLRPLHDALVALLTRALALPAADDDVLRLAVALTGLGVHMHTGRDAGERLAPGLMAGSAAIDLWNERLTMFGLAMVEAERARRSR